MKLGIIGAGKIVKEVLGFINDIENIKPVAICSRPESIEKLESLSKSYGIEKVYTDYKDLLADEDIDAVYIAYPNDMHFEIMDAALDFGKNIICEKPFAANIGQAMKIFAKADRKNLYVMEAVSHRFLPNALEIKNKVKDLGKVKIISLNYSQYSSRYEDFLEEKFAPVFRLENAGGALMDINFYNIDFAVMVFGRPSDVRYFPNIEKSIDTSGVFVMDYDDFKVVCVGAKDSDAENISTIQGDAGTIEIAGPVNFCPSFTLKKICGEVEKINKNQNVSRLFYEFVAFEKMVRENDRAKIKELENTSLITAEIINQARIESGIFFPSDENF